LENDLRSALAHEAPGGWSQNRLHKHVMAKLAENGGKVPDELKH